LFLILLRNEMLCYKDMTFCDFYKDCKDGDNCNRSFTPKVKEDAKANDLPACCFIDKPDCFKQKGGIT